MRILIASDKFKGSLTGPEVAAALAEGIRSVDAGIRVDTAPVADGGEGTVDAALAAGFHAETQTVAGPTGEPVTARYAVRTTTGGTGEAVIELAAASGLALLPDGVRAPLKATSRGTGELIRAAMDRGCTTIVLGVGGSACTDGGAGMLQALGARLQDADGAEVAPGGAALASLARVELSGLDPRISDTGIVLAADVDNPLLGPDGAAAVFAPQKGARPAEVAVLDAALAHWADLLESQPGVRAATGEPGAGAAGGVGYAALAVLGARRERGTEVVQRFTGLANAIRLADLVITGEGSLDQQSLRGKAPVGVARTAVQAGVPVVAVCGSATLSAAQAEEAGFARVYTVADLAPDLETAVTDARRFLVAIGVRIAADAASPS